MKTKLKSQAIGKSAFRYGAIVLGAFLIFLISGSAFSQIIVKSIPSPGPEPRGLTWDGSYLWCAEYSSGKIFKLDPLNGAKIDSLFFPLESDFGGLAWGSSNQIWIANGSYVYEIDPYSGDTLSNFHCPGG